MNLSSAHENEKYWHQNKIIEIHRLHFSVFLKGSLNPELPAPYFILLWAFYKITARAGYNCVRWSSCLNQGY